MTGDQARLTFDAACGMGHDCLAFLASIQPTEDCYEFLRWRERVVSLLGHVYFELLGPLFAAHPELQEGFRLPAFPDGFAQLNRKATGSPVRMSRDTAEKVVPLYHSVFNRGNDLLRALQGNTTDEEFKLWRKRMAQVLGTLMDEVLRPLFREYPEYEAKVFRQDSAEKH